MTRQETINGLEELKFDISPASGLYVGTIRTELLDTAIKSLEAWDEVIGHLETTVRELQESNQTPKEFCSGITFAVAMMKNHMKEVKE